jgi:hypothetical protein
MYEKLGFKQPNILVNPYGIKIYVGTKGEDDWCVEIPKELCKKKCACYKYDKNYIFYLVTEDHALALAEIYTELVKKIKG